MLSEIILLSEYTDHNHSSLSDWHQSITDVQSLKTVNYIIYID